MKLGKPFDDADYDMCFESYSVACEKEDLGEEKHEVMVSRVLYGKRDIEKVINGN